MKKLEDAGFVRVKKEFIGRKPRTTYECTHEGRKILNNYLQQMQKLLEQTQ